MTSSKINQWAEIRIDAPAFLLDPIADFLNELSSPGAIFSEDKKNLPNYERLTAFLPKDQKLSARLLKLKNYLKELASLFPDQRIFGPKIQTLRDQDWINKWRESIVPLRVSKKFWVVPEWRKVPEEAKKPGQFVIKMEPGLAFGTGFHPTTQLCLEFIEELVPKPARLVMDLGTGTGILAIASAMLGAEKVLGMDIDPLALKVAKDNLKRNQLQDKISLLRTSAKPQPSVPKIKMDLIIANLHLAELLRLQKYLFQHLKPKGHLVLSGILREQARALISCYQRLGMKLLKRKEREKWLAILMRKS